MRWTTERRHSVAVMAFWFIASTLNAQGIELLSYRPAGGEGPEREIELLIPVGAGGSSSFPEIRPEEGNAEFLQANFSPYRTAGGGLSIRAIVLVSSAWTNEDRPPRLSVRYPGEPPRFHPEAAPPAVRDEVYPSKAESAAPVEPLRVSAAFDRSEVAPGGITFLEIRYRGGVDLKGLATPELRSITGGIQAGEPTRLFLRGGKELLIRYPIRAEAVDALRVDALGEKLLLPIRAEAAESEAEAISSTAQRVVQADASAGVRNLKAWPIVCAVSALIFLAIAIAMVYMKKRKRRIIFPGR